MSCTRYRDLLSRYIDGEVTPRQRRELMAHVEQCHDCAAWLARARQADVLLKGAPDTQPSDRVRESVLNNARRASPPGGLRPQMHGHGHAQFPAGGNWHLYTAGLLMRFDLSPQRIAVASAAALLSIVGLAYWLNILPPLGGYDKFGFLFPREQEQAPISSAPPPLPAISTGYNGVGGSVAAPNLVRLAPADNALDVAPTESLRVRFDLPMDRASVEDASRIDPPAAGAFSWDADNELRFTPESGGLLRGVTYTISISSSAHSLAGTRLAQPLLWSFRTREPYSVAPLEASGSTISPTGTFTLLFDEPMVTAQSNNAVSLRAEGSSMDLPASFSWDAVGKRLIVAPNAAMPGSMVTLRVAADARTRSGDTLGRTSEFTYAVDLPTPRLRLLSGRLALASVGSQVPVKYEALAAPDTPLDGVGLELYKLPGERLSELQAQAHDWPSALPGGLPTVLNRINVPVGKLADGSPNPDAEARQLTGLAPGTYLLIARAASRAGTLTDWQLLAVADRRMAALNDGAFWATDETGKVWANAEVSLYSPTGELLEKGLTNNAGLWLSTKADEATLAIARDLGGHLAALLIPKSKVQNPKPKIALSASLETDLPSYYPGQAVSFRALLHPAGPDSTWATPISEQDVSVSLLNPQGLVVSALILKPDNVGGVSGMFPLAEGIQAGQYAIRVRVGDAWRDFPLTVIPPRSDTLSVLVGRQATSPDAAQAQVLTYSVGVLGPRGEAASSAQLTATLGIAGDNWSSVPITATTDANGNATIAVPLPAWTALYNEPDLYINVDSAWRGYAGHDQSALDLITPHRLLSGIIDLASPSLGIAAVAQSQKGGATRLRIVALDSQQQAQGDLLVQAQSPSGERQAWAIDLAGAGGDVTVPIPKQFVGGNVYFSRGGIEGSRQIMLQPPQNGNLALDVSVPRTAAPGAPLPATLHLTDREGQGVEGAASLWFRRVSDDPSPANRGWEPALPIEASGTATATLSAPSSPGLWFVMCVAATAEGAHAAAWSVVDVLPAPTILLPPAQAMQTGRGPQTVSIAVYNPNDTPLSSGVSVQGDEGLRVIGTSSQGIDVPAVGWQRLDWGVIADRPGRADLEFSFLPSAEVEGTWKLDTLSSEGARSNTTYASGVLIGQKTVGVQVPSGLSDNNVELEIRASTSLLSTLADATRVLQSQATGSTAMAAVRLSAAPFIASAYRRAGLGVPSQIASSEIECSLALQQLYSAQHADGGWGADLDPNAGLSSPTETAGVLLAMRRQALAWAKAGGETAGAALAVDEEVQSRALAYLSWESARPVGERPTTALLDERARSLYVLSLYGAVKSDDIRPLLANAASGGADAHLSPAGQAWLALALWQVGDMGDAQALTDRLPILDFGFWILDQDQSRIQNPVAEQTYARALMEMRQGALWASPQVTADALWALSHYAYAAQSDEKGTGNPTLTLNDSSVQTAAQPDNPGTLDIVLTGGALHAGTNWLKLQAPTASQPLYYSLTLRATR